MIDSDLDRAARTIADSEAILIGAGAGMGVDSGLPDFRGDQGFWRAYPPYERLGLNFVSLANPRWFRDDPTLAWGFYGHRMGLYRRTTPHLGFAILRGWARRMRRGAFVFTSNVDGHFERTGFGPEQIVEVHGSFEGMQCTNHCGIEIFPGSSVEVEVDPETMRAVGRLPECPECGALARPNILMFGDFEWEPARTYAQTRRMNSWLGRREGAKLAVVECGAGQAVPTVRATCQRIAREHGGTLIRINTREPEVPSGHISIPLGALAALKAIDGRLGPSSGIRESPKERAGNNFPDRP
jgi:NAD-dependent SIR2 family protein deacetylase